MFGIGLPEMIVIAIVALVFIGPKNLPGVLRSVGRGLVQLKRATNEVRTTVQDEMDQIEREIDLKDVREAATDLKKDFDGVKSGLDPLSMNPPVLQKIPPSVIFQELPKPRNPLHKSDSGGSSSLSFFFPHQHPDRRRGGLVGLNASQTDVPLSAGFAQPLLMLFHIFQVMLPLIRGNPALLAGLFQIEYH